MNTDIKKSKKCLKPFVKEGSIVKEIWGNRDTILLVFAGASAEFALNKAVDWLFYTGKLPNDPLGRLFSTVNYAKNIVFSDEESAFKYIHTISAIHHQVENSRGYQIPDWAYRDVLYMLIDYSIRSYELLERSLTEEERNEIYDVFLRLGKGMHLQKLPATYQEWEKSRIYHMTNNLEWSEHTKALHLRYRKHLGGFRYWLLRETQILLVPNLVRKKLKLRSISFILPLFKIYRILKRYHLENYPLELILPKKYKNDISSLNFKEKVKNMGCFMVERET